MLKGSVASVPSVHLVFDPLIEYWSVFLARISRHSLKLAGCASGIFVFGYPITFCALPLADISPGHRYPGQWVMIRLIAQGSRADWFYPTYILLLLGLGLGLRLVARHSQLCSIASASEARWRETGISHPAARSSWVATGILLIPLVPLVVTVALGLICWIFVFMAASVYLFSEGTYRGRMRSAVRDAMNERGTFI